MWTAAQVVERSLELSGACGIRASPETWGKVSKYLEILEKYAPAMNLVGARDMETMAGHVAEGIVCTDLGLRAPEAGLGWLDVGSGGGLPGLIVAASGVSPLVLIEPRARRAAFLELCLSAVGRADVPVRRQNVASDGIGQRFGVVSARAVFPLGEWLDLAAALVSPGGWIIGHTRPGSGDPVGHTAVERVSVGPYEVRAYVPRGT